MHSSPSSEQLAHLPSIETRNPIQAEAPKPEIAQSLAARSRNSNADRQPRRPSHPVAQRRYVINLAVIGLSTSQVSEGSNLYFTNARVASYMEPVKHDPERCWGSIRQRARIERIELDIARHVELGACRAGLPGLGQHYRNARQPD